MGMPHPITQWNVARVLALPDDGNRYEVVDGELLVTPAPSLPHQQAVQILYERLAPFVRQHAIGSVLLSPADIELDDRTLVQPDLFVAPLIEGRRPRSWKEIRPLLLAVEVLAPSTARADRQIKRRRYQRHGVAEYWIVDLEARLVECWTPADERPADPHRAAGVATVRRGSTARDRPAPTVPRSPGRLSQTAARSRWRISTPDAAAGWHAPDPRVSLRHAYPIR